MWGGNHVGGLGARGRKRPGLVQGVVNSGATSGRLRLELQAYGVGRTDVRRHVDQLRLGEGDKQVGCTGGRLLVG